MCQGGRRPFLPPVEIEFAPALALVLVHVFVVAMQDGFSPVTSQNALKPATAPDDQYSHRPPRPPPPLLLPRGSTVGCHVLIIAFSGGTVRQITQSDRIALLTLKRLRSAMATGPTPMTARFCWPTTWQPGSRSGPPCGPTPSRPRPLEVAGIGHRASKYRDSHADWPGDRAGGGILAAGDCASDPRCPPSASCPAIVPRVAFIPTINCVSFAPRKNGHVPSYRIRPRRAPGDPRRGDRAQTHHDHGAVVGGLHWHLGWRPERPHWHGPDPGSLHPAAARPIRSACTGMYRTAALAPACT